MEVKKLNKDRDRFGGCSDSFGFEIFNKNGNVIEVKDKTSLSKLNRMIVLTVSTSVLLFIFQTFLLLILSIITTISWCIYLLKASHYDLSEWHAIEHKLIYLLENNCLLTVDNFIKTSIKGKRCGSKNTSLREPSLRKINMAIEAGEKYLNTQ